MIHKRTTATALPDHWLANLTVNCGQILKQAEPVHLNRVSNKDEEKCLECSHVDNDETSLPFVSYWEDTALPVEISVIDSLPADVMLFLPNRNPGNLSSKQMAERGVALASRIDET